MRAIVYDGLGGVSLSDLPSPPLSEGQVRVSTRVTGVSAGTETFHLRTRRDGAALIPGYQNVGLVTERGIGVASLADGQRIYTHHWRGGELPLHPTFGEIRLGSGAQASERIGPAVSADLIALPDWIPDVQAAFLSVSSIGLHATRRGGVAPGKKVLVAGLGLVGLNAVQGSNLQGAEVYGLDRVPFRLDVARTLGCTVFDGTQERVWEDVASAGPFDLIVETTGANALMDPLLRVVAGERTLEREMVRQGTIVMVGLRPKTEYTFSLAHPKEVILAHTSHHTRQDLDDVMGWLQRGAWKIDPLVTHHITPEEAPAFYQRLSQGTEDVLGVAIHWNGN
jgi:2-desacetyl-2-hydroxyethyl bacteriochlorophyllide A dehydrogenase